MSTECLCLRQCKGPPWWCLVISPPSEHDLHDFLNFLFPGETCYELNIVLHTWGISEIKARSSVYCLWPWESHFSLLHLSPAAQWVRLGSEWTLNLVHYRWRTDLLLQPSIQGAGRAGSGLLVIKCNGKTGECTELPWPVGSTNCYWCWGQPCQSGPRPPPHPTGSFLHLWLLLLFQEVYWKESHLVALPRWFLLETLHCLGHIAFEMGRPNSCTAREMPHKLEEAEASCGFWVSGYCQEFTQWTHRSSTPSAGCVWFHVTVVMWFCDSTIESSRIYIKWVILAGNIRSTQCTILLVLVWSLRDRRFQSGVTSWCTVWSVKLCLL